MVTGTGPPKRPPRPPRPASCACSCAGAQGQAQGIEHAGVDPHGIRHEFTYATGGTSMNSPRNTAADTEGCLLLGMQATDHSLIGG